MFFSVIPSSCRNAARNRVSHVGNSSWALKDGTPFITTLSALKVCENVSQTCCSVGTGSRGSRRLIPSISVSASTGPNTFTNCSGKRDNITVIDPSEAVKKTVSMFSSVATAFSIVARTSRMASTATLNSIVCMAPCIIFIIIPNSSGKLMSGVPDSPIILQFLAFIKSL